MRAQSCDAPVLENSAAASDIRLMRVRLPEGQPSPKAGMFYMLRAWAADEPPLLSRPISVHRWDEASRELEFLYQVKGKGTEKLAALCEGETVSLTGPAGNGFPVEAARGSGVQLLHENEKHIYGDVPERCLEILKAFPGEILATYDPSNFVQCGVKNREAFEMLRPYVRYLHVKDSVYTGKTAVADKGFDTVTDAHRPAGLGDGELPWILGELKKMDYRGFASIEPHLSGGDFVPGTGADKFAAAANALKGLLAQI